MTDKKSIDDASMPTGVVFDKHQKEEMSGDEMMKKTMGLINRAAGVSDNVNYLSDASIDALMLAIMSDRAELLENTLRTQVDQVRAKNDQLKEANEILASARGAKSNTGEEGRTAVPPEVAKFFDDNNIKWNGNATQNSSQWGLAIENLKGFSESLTSTSQLDMTKLQSTSGKFNQTFEMMSQFISKYYRSSDNIIKNI